MLKKVVGKSITVAGVDHLILKFLRYVLGSVKQTAMIKPNLTSYFTSPELGCLYKKIGSAICTPYSSCQSLECERVMVIGGIGLPFLPPNFHEYSDQFVWDDLYVAEKANCYRHFGDCMALDNWICPKF